MAWPHHWLADESSRTEETAIEPIRQSDHFQEPMYDQPDPNRLDPADLNIRALLIGDVNRMSFIHRFNTALVLHRENNAEHSYYVALYGMVIVFWCQNTYASVVGTPSGRLEEAFQKRMANPSMEGVLIKALVHDLEEVRTGDFTRRFKHAHPDLKEKLEHYAGLEFDGVIKDLAPLNGHMRSRLAHDWRYSKDSSPEGRVVALADFMSVLSHMWYEIRCSNVSMQDNYQDMLEYSAVFDAHDFGFLRPIIDEVQRITLEVMTQAKRL